MKKRKAKKDEIWQDLLGAMGSWLENNKGRFTPNDVTMPECEQMDILLNNDLIYKINFINQWNPKRRYKYIVYRDIEGRMTVYKIFK